MLGFFQRKDKERVQALPALVTGIGMICSSVISRNLRRKKLLTQISIEIYKINFFSLY